MTNLSFYNPIYRRLLNLLQEDYPAAYTAFGMEQIYWEAEQYSGLCGRTIRTLQCYQPNDPSWEMRRIELLAEVARLEDPDLLANTIKDDDTGAYRLAPEDRARLERLRKDEIEWRAIVAGDQ